MLELDDSERPECTDLRLFSMGVPRFEEDGVTLFLKAVAGEYVSARLSSVGSGCGVVGRLLGKAGELGIIDIRFILRASVGLIVLAPKPVA